MSDRENPPGDLFDVICRLDDLAEWLEDGWADEAVDLRALSDRLKGYITISLKRPAPPTPEAP